jgi:hypothetical protein
LTFTMPNYTGEVLSITPSDTPFLSAIGGLNEQGEVIFATEFEGQTQDLGTPSQPDVLEGADAPALSGRTRGTWNNIVQPFHYAFGVSYTRQAATQALAGLNIGGQRNPVQDELAYQSNIKLTEAARDMNFTFLNGAYRKPSDNTQSRRTRGLNSAIVTNALSNLGAVMTTAFAASTDAGTFNAHGLTAGQQVRVSNSAATGLANGVYVVRDVTTNTFKVSSVVGGAAVNVTADGNADVQLLQPLTSVRVLDLVQLVWDTHGINSAAEPTLIVNAGLKRALTKLFITDKGYQEMSRNVAGVSVTQIETDFGKLNLMVERAQSGNRLTFAHLGLIKPAYLLIPEKGFLFTEELARTGAQRKFQLYGEAGLWHGPEQAHARIDDVGLVAGA